VAVGLDGDLFPKGEGRSSLFRSLAEGLAFLRAVDPAEADTFRVLVVQNFEGVTVQVLPPSTLEAVTATEHALIRPLFGR